MNRFEIRDVLKQHQGHFRVLPTKTMLDLQGIIDSVDNDESLKEIPEDVVGNRVSKTAKKPSRSKR